MNSSLLKILIDINPKIPKTNPKLINPCGIQKLSISIKVIQINKDKNNQLKNTIKKKFELVPKKEGLLFANIRKRVPVINSIKGYLEDINELQLIHFPF